MSKIDDQIKQLQLKKKKIEFLEHILHSAANYENKEFNEVKEDVIIDLEKYIKEYIQNIESGVADSKAEPDELTAEDIQVVKMLAQKAKTRVSAPTQPAAAAPQKKKPIADPNDKLTFAMNNRHLANKRVSVANDKNMQVNGEVVGLDAPNVIVKTDTGPTIEVPITNISLLN